MTDAADGRDAGEMTITAAGPLSKQRWAAGAFR